MMPAAWMVYIIVLTALVTLAALAAERLVSIWGGPRRFIWLVALVVPIVAPVVVGTHIIPPGAAAQIPASAGAPWSDRLTPIAPPTMRATSPTTGTVQVVRSTREAVWRQLPMAIEPYLIAVWLVTSAALLSVFIVALGRLRQQSSGWRETELDSIRVLIAPDAGPAVVGALRPRIVMPAWSLSLDARARGLMLRHELEHIRARDPQLLLMAALSLVFFPWNLALWFAARRLRLAVEIDCDRRVLQACGDSRHYGLLLVAVGARRGTLLPLGAALVARRPLLERRIRAMTAQKPRYPVLRSLPAIACMAIVSVGAAGAPRPMTPLISIQTGIRGTADVEAAKPQRRSGAMRESVTVSIRPLPPTAGNGTPGVGHATRQTQPTPRITVEWVDAPIETVIAAFAAFSGRTITASKSVNGSVTALIIDQPWDVALAVIMRASGYHVLINPDSSILISSAANAKRESGDVGSSLGAARTETTVAEPLASLLIGSRSRTIAGIVADDATGRPIASAQVDVIGAQAVGEVNRACANDRGEFRMRVPDGEVWLDAKARGYEFRRVTLAPNDTVVTFRGRPIARRLLADSSLGGVPNDEIESVEVIKGAMAATLYGAAATNGVIVIKTKRGRVLVQEPWLVNGQIQLRPPPALGAPLILVDGAVVGAAAAPEYLACEGNSAR